MGESEAEHKPKCERWYRRNLPWAGKFEYFDHMTIALIATMTKSQDWMTEQEGGSYPSRSFGASQGVRTQGRARTALSPLNAILARVHAISS
jgi:hypothetical protein